MWKRLLILLLALALLFGGLFGLKHYQRQQMAAEAALPQPPATVSAVPVAVESWQPYVRAVGSLVASQGVEVANEVQGVVRAIRFESGQAVERGALLVELDESVDQAELQGLLAGQGLAQMEFDRAAELWKKRLVPRADYDRAEATLRERTAQVASKRAVIQKKAIRAPFTGRLGIRKVDLGQYLAPGTPIVSLQALDPLYVDFSVAERHLARLSLGQEALLTVQAYPEQTFGSRITAIQPDIDEATRTVSVRASLMNRDGRLQPGMFAELRIVLPARQGLLTLPRTAISYNAYGDLVFVVTGQGRERRVETRPVETGEVREGRVEITKGLQAGDLVVSAGQVKLRPGQAVTIDNSVRLGERAGSS